MTSPVIHIDDVQTFSVAPEAGSERFGAAIAPLGQTMGLSGLGATLINVEPGKRAFPFHNHLGKDEMFVILEGEGTYRFGEGEHPLRAGSVCGAPKGGPDTAHQIINTGSMTLRYIGISTSNDPEVVEYPDSGKFAAIAVAPGSSFMEAHLRYVGRSEQSLDYWDGEEL